MLSHWHWSTWIPRMRFFPTLEFWSSVFRFQGSFVLAISSSFIAFVTLSPVSLFQCLYLLFRFFLLLPSCWPDAHTGIIILLYLPFLKKLSEICTLPISIKRNNLKNTLACFYFSFQSFFKPFRFLNVDKHLECFYCMSIASLVSSFLFNNTSQEVHVDCTYLYNVFHRDLAFL